MSTIEELQDLIEINVGDTNLVKKLGEGSIGTVYTLQNTCYPIAFKCIKNANLQNELAAVESEAFKHLREKSNAVIKYHCTKEMFM